MSSRSSSPLFDEAGLLRQIGVLAVSLTPRVGRFTAFASGAKTANAVAASIMNFPMSVAGSRFLFTDDANPRLLSRPDAARANRGRAVGASPFD